MQSVDSSIPQSADTHPLSSESQAVSYGVSFHGDGGTLFRIYAINLLKVLGTLGVYYFWLKAKVRGYVYSQTELAGERFAFHGTGLELLKGWAKAAVLIIAVVALLAGVESAVSPEAAEVAGRILGIAFGVFVVPVAIVGSRRYRLSRTSWRGIRFVFRGRVNDLARQMFRDGFWTGATLGVYYPFMLNNLREFVVRNSAYGNVAFEYDGKGGRLWRIYLFGVVFGILTLGIYYFWFSAARQRFYWSHTSFAGARFVSKVTGGGMFRLIMGNAVLLVLTLGLAAPWAKVRRMRYLASMLTLEGTLDLTAVLQQIQAAGATGEGLADMVDTGFFDVDLGV